MAVTGFNDSRILIASHPLPPAPWADANDDERLDVNNGILLSPTYDALFDKYLITFDNSGQDYPSWDSERRVQENRSFW